MPCTATRSPRRDAALAEAYHLLAAQGDRGGGRDPEGRARAHRSAAEPRRPRALHLAEPAGRAADARPRAALGRARRAVARRPHQSLPLRHEPRLVRAVAARDARPHQDRTRRTSRKSPSTCTRWAATPRYYFAPPADPHQPVHHQDAGRWLETFGRANAARFDERGFAYFIREVYDSFYPGYGESWPIFQGAIGMTYEQASARGLRFAARDGTTADVSRRRRCTTSPRRSTTVRHGGSEPRAAAARLPASTGASAVADGETAAPREYVLVPGRDPSMAERLARAARASQGIEVRAPTEPFKLGTRQDVAGGRVPRVDRAAVRTPGAQPARAHVPQPEAFVKEQDRRRRKRLERSDLRRHRRGACRCCRASRSPPLDRATSVRATPLGSSSAGSAPIAWREGRVPGAVGLRRGQSRRSGTLRRRPGPPRRQSPSPWAAGSTPPAPPSSACRTTTTPTIEKFGALVKAAPDVEVVPIDTGWVDQGPSLGSSDVVALKAPRVLLLWDTPTYSQSAGWARFVLERRFHQPVTAVRVSSIGRLELTSFDVIVLPSGNYGRRLATIRCGI